MDFTYGPYTPGLGCDSVCVCVMSFPDAVWFPLEWPLIRASSTGEQQRGTQYF